MKDIAINSKYVILRELIHKANTPLATSLGYAQLLLAKAELAPSQQEWLETLEQELHKVSAFLKQMGQELHKSDSDSSPTNP